eukprot:GFUD01018455.1.p1 GENE.GFUD01018455.1~~GFUD01018455.1.p1  ORF type:complete len:442 (-),score=132.52 GFUD01018455.1:138-1406(-)
MEKILEDVEKISKHIFIVLGENFRNLFDQNMIFEMVEEHQSEPSEVRVANIVNNIIENYAAHPTSDIELNNNVDVGRNATPKLQFSDDLDDDGASSVPVSSAEDIKSADHHSLVQSLSSMFPDTPIDYIWDQAQDLVGKPAAIERFTKQLLENHLPPANWTLSGLTLECECCYTDSPEKDLVSCPVGHTFCQQCVRTATSVAMGEGKTAIRCMVECREEMNWQQLRRALEPNVLFKLEQKKQAEDVIAAGLDNLVSCPFCPYQTVMEDPHDKVLICRNPECGKDSCRLCQEPSHIPKRCGELLQVEGARKKIEEQLSLAMLRECWQCKKMFYKEQGCNHMTCTCGARMCYICKKRVDKADHYYGTGSHPTPDRPCPLYSDIQALHKQEVSAAALKAKEELARSTNLTSLLKIDVEEGKIVVD